MTHASELALTNLRDLSTLKWYVIPFLALVFYIYAREIKAARSSGNWDAIYAGLTLFGMDFINGTWNGWGLHFTQRSVIAGSSLGSSFLTHPFFIETRDDL